MSVARKIDGRPPDWLRRDPAAAMDPVRLLYLNVATAANLLSPGSLPMSRPGP